jgi:hypothetical protein
MQEKRERWGGYMESSFLSHDHFEKRSWQRCDSPAILLDCSAFVDIELGTLGTSETEPPGCVQIGLINLEKHSESCSKRSMVAQFLLQFCEKTDRVLGMHSKL